MEEYRQTVMTISHDQHKGLIAKKRKETISNHDNVSIAVDVFFDDKITPKIFGNILAFRDEKFAGSALVSQAIYTRDLTE